MLRFFFIRPSDLITTLIYVSSKRLKENLNCSSEYPYLTIDWIWGFEFVSVKRSIPAQTKPSPIHTPTKFNIHR